MRNFGKKAIYIVVAAIGLAAGYLKWALWEPSSIARDSILYWLKVPPEARQFPLWAASGEVLYDVRIAGGEKPAFAVINYSSSYTLGQLLSSSEGLGFRCDVFDTKEALCEKNAEEGRPQQIGITEADGNRRVAVLLGGY